MLLQRFVRDTLRLRRIVFDAWLLRRFAFQCLGASRFNSSTLRVSTPRRFTSQRLDASRFNVSTLRVSTSRRFAFQRLHASRYNASTLCVSMTRRFVVRRSTLQRFEHTDTDVLIHCFCTPQRFSVSMPGCVIAFAFQSTDAIVTSALRLFVLSAQRIASMTQRFWTSCSIMYRW